MCAQAPNLSPVRTPTDDDDGGGEVVTFKRFSIETVPHHPSSAVAGCFDGTMVMKLELREVKGTHFLLTNPRPQCQHHHYRRRRRRRRHPPSRSGCRRHRVVVVGIMESPDGGTAGRSSSLSGGNSLNSCHQPLIYDLCGSGLSSF